MAGKFFVSTTDYYLDTITMRISDTQSNSPDSISLWIAENSGSNLPSATAVLTKVEFTLSISNSFSNILFDPVEAPILRAGNYYWLVATVEDSPADFGYAWDSNLSYSPGSNLAGRNIGGDWSQIVYDPLAFQISGTEVPIPGAVWLLGSGLIVFAGSRKKFKT
jgi:hypothetical protein